MQATDSHHSLGLQFLEFPVCHGDRPRPQDLISTASKYVLQKELNRFLTPYPVKNTSCVLGALPSREDAQQDSTFQDISEVAWLQKLLSAKKSEEHGNVLKKTISITWSFFRTPIIVPNITSAWAVNKSRLHAQAASTGALATETVWIK